MGARRDIGTIRMATFDDAPALANMHVASWRETYASILPAAMLASLSVQKRQAIVSVPVDQLGEAVGSLSDESQLIVAALDELLTRAWK
jgi:hypothetical protein